MSRAARRQGDGCPDWALLVSRRGDEGDSLGGDWERALGHLDDGCQECRRRAFEADPLLVFRRLPTVEPAASEIDEMRLAVSTLRRAGELTRRPAGSVGGLRLAAGLCLLLLGLTLGGSRLEAPASSDIAATSRAESALPLVEGLDRPGARVYQLRQDDLAVVMIVDETLDI